MLDDAGISELNVNPHTFRRTAGTIIARATDAETAADVLGTSPEVAKNNYIRPEEPKPNASPALYLQELAPRLQLTAARQT